MSGRAVNGRREDISVREKKVCGLATRNGGSAQRALCYGRGEVAGTYPSEPSSVIGLIISGRIADGTWKLGARSNADIFVLQTSSHRPSLASYTRARLMGQKHYNFLNGVVSGQLLRTRNQEAIRECLS